MVGLAPKMNGSNFDCHKLDFDDEPLTELDPNASRTEPGGMDYETDNVEETPKAKKKAMKLASKAINANHGKATGKKPEVRAKVDDTEDDIEVMKLCDEEAPKTKKKMVKPTIREVINANCGEPASGKKVR
jgi:hypothetical protein